MDIIEQLVIEVFENRQDYSDLDYLTIMNILKETYMRFNGDTTSHAIQTGYQKEVEEDELDEYYESFIKPTTMRKLINEGYLSDYEFYAPVKPDVSKVKVSNTALFLIY